jgi:hypothetical protein
MITVTHEPVLAALTGELEQLSVGDRLRITRNDSALDLANGAGSRWRM